MRAHPSGRRPGRLTKRSEFVAAASGRRFHSERMTAQGLLRGDDGAGPRVGLTVTKKVGHATERNRIKRRLRAATTAALARRDVAALPEPAPDMDVVLVARRAALSAAFPRLVEDVARALHALAKPGPRGRGRAAPDAGERRPEPSPKP